MKIGKPLFLAVSLPLMLGTGPAPDGSRDFNFSRGAWSAHVRQLAHPMKTSGAWSTYDATVTVRDAIHGAASVEEIGRADAGGEQLLDVRLYNATSHQWSLNAATSSEGTLGEPALGRFAAGRGTFYRQTNVDGRAVLERQAYFDISDSSFRTERSYSVDAGRTWTPFVQVTFVRSSAAAPSERSEHVTQPSHDFDFSYGTWATHIRSFDTSSGKLVRPTLYTGTVAWRKIWGGRAYLEELKASNASGGFEGLTLFLYSPKARQWSQTFAGKGSGSFDRSMTGSFRAGRGELVSFPVKDGSASVLAREVWSQIHPDRHHFEIDYSADGGTTWAVSFAADLSRTGPGL